MGGHGGLNILPQKKWNVYNWDNRDKVAHDQRTLQAAIKRNKDNHASKALQAKVA